MASIQATLAAGCAVRAYLAEIGSVFLGEVFDPVDNAEHRKWWEHIEEFFDGRCAYCHTEKSKLRKGVRMTREHLIETNQFACGLHHPGNVVPACSECNVSRGRLPNGGWPTWEDHLRALAEVKGWKTAAVERRRRKILEFIEVGGYPELSKEELAHLKKTAKALYKEVLARCSADRREFVKIHGEDAVRVR